MLDEIMKRACAALPSRCEYARAVILGRQRWSGSDLRGNAARFGASYAYQRRKARAAWFGAGGSIIRIEKGLWVGAVQVCVDDYGNAIYRTTAGLARPNTASQFTIFA